jgi:hypothetical protein
MHTVGVSQEFLELSAHARITPGISPCVQLVCLVLVLGKIHLGSKFRPPTMEDHISIYSICCNHNLVLDDTRSGRGKCGLGTQRDEAS